MAKLPQQGSKQECSQTRSDLCPCCDSALCLFHSRCFLGVFPALTSISTLSLVPGQARLTLGLSVRIPWRPCEEVNIQMPTTVIAGAAEQTRPCTFPTAPTLTDRGTHTVPAPRICPDTPVHAECHWDGQPVLLRDRETYLKKTRKETACH